jgi:hypothetical protein
MRQVLFNVSMYVGTLEYLEVKGYWGGLKARVPILHLRYGLRGYDISYTPTTFFLEDILILKHEYSCLRELKNSYSYSKIGAN